MSYIHVSYNSVEDLIDKLQSGRYSAAPPSQKNPPPNFVLVTPRLYHGTYGGLVFDSALRHRPRREYLAESVDAGVSLVWWNSCAPERAGDRALTVEGGRVAVTPHVYRQLLLNPLRGKKFVGQSSYFGPSARRINSRSFSNSDSE